MRPVAVSVVVPAPPERVFDAIAVLADHESFTDHFLVEWSVSGPPAGVGARARMRVKKPGRPDWLEMEVVESARPHRTVERSVSAGGKRVTRGAYELAPTGDGGTRIEFILAWEQAPLGERLIAPLTRAITRRANAKSLTRLAAKLQERGTESEEKEKS